VQISDSHMGFQQTGQPGCSGNTESARRQDQWPNGAAGIHGWHTGDISHLSKPEEFDTVDQI